MEWSRWRLRIKLERPAPDRFGERVTPNGKFTFGRRARHLRAANISELLFEAHRHAVGSIERRRSPVRRLRLGSRSPRWTGTSGKSARASRALLCVRSRYVRQLDRDRTALDGDADRYARNHAGASSQRRSGEHPERALWLADGRSQFGDLHTVDPLADYDLGMLGLANRTAGFFVTVLPFDLVNRT